MIEIFDTEGTYNISYQTVQTAQNAMVQILQDLNFLGTLEDGTAVFDLLVKPNALIYAIIQKDIDRAKAYLSLEKAMELKDALGSEYDKVVDAILSNWFVKRKEGDKATGYIRCLFSKPIETFVALKESTIFSISGNTFVPKHDQVFLAEDFNRVVSGTVVGKSQYYIDVLVESLNPSSTFVTLSDIVTANITDIFYLSSYIPYEFAQGSSAEETDAFIERTQDVITTRELISHKAINTVIRNEFAGVNNVYVAGYGDPEQMRDLRSFNYVAMHIGNHADIYVNAPYTLITKSENLDWISPANPSILSFRLAETVSEITKVELLCQVVRENKATKEVTTVQEYVEFPFTVGYFDKAANQIKPMVAALYMSVDHNTVVTIDDANPMYTADPTIKQRPVILNRANLTDNTKAPNNVRVTYVTLPLVRQVQTYVGDAEHRLINYHPLVKSYFPIILRMLITVTQKEAYNLEAPELQKKVKEAVVTFINSIPANDNFLLSDLVYEIKNKVIEVKQVKLDRTNVEYVHRDLNTGRFPYVYNNAKATFAVNYSIIADEFILENVYDSITRKTIQFYTDASFIKVDLVNE